MVHDHVHAIIDSQAVHLRSGGQGLHKRGGAGSGTVSEDWWARLDCIGVAAPVDDSSQHPCAGAALS
jgi:hypothetical protein